jgi:hypothetical protein
MDTKQVLTDLRAELNRIDRAIVALESLDGTGSLKATVPSAPPAPIKARGRRRLSAAARKRLSEATKKRWMKYRKESAPAPAALATKAAPKQTAAKRRVAKGGLSAAGRKRLSEMMKKRWAEKRKQKAKAA